MSWNTCKFPECENWTYRPDVDYCETHRRANLKEEAEAKKQVEKRNTLIAKQREKNQVPRKTISKNPKDWGNTFLCSDGTRVTEAQVRNRLFKAYKWSSYTEQGICLGCGEQAQGHAHIISKRRCKLKGRTELIWDKDNFFEACNKCNSAIDTPKGKEWKYLLNINTCLSFIKQHDPELYTKFELSAVNQENPTIKIRGNIYS